jgi:hypothetical protein
MSHRPFVHLHNHTGYSLLGGDEPGRNNEEMVQTQAVGCITDAGQDDNMEIHVESLSPAAGAL